ncbi:MAG: glycosyltransferase [Bacilli bacterium]|nr:glycosyltransferase [Bacilli bacterium]
MKLDIVVPTYNNEKQISNIYNKICEDLKDLKINIIFVDDNSTDKTIELLKNIQKNDEDRVKLLSMSKNFGKDTCILAGLKYTKNELICIYDIDSLVNTSFIKKMYDYIQEHNEYDQICMLSNKDNIGKIELFNKIFNLNIDINKTYTRLMKRNVLTGILELSNKLTFSNYIFELIGFNTYYLKYESKKIENNYKLRKYLVYSKNPFKLIKLINYLLILLTIIIMILSLLNKINVSNNVILITILSITIIQLSTSIYTTNNILKKECNNYYILKDKIGFEDNIL